MSSVRRFEHGSRVPGWDEAADLTKDPAAIPDPAVVDVPSELRAEIEAAMALYPDPHSAALPALAAAQRLHGWCSPQAIEQVACVMRLTPAYLTSVATFYDMFELHPVGRHNVYVCTNISCSLRGGEGGQGRRVRIGIERHRRLDLGTKLAGHVDERRVGDAGRVLGQIGRRVPAWDARAMLEAANGAHRSMPPRIGSSIASVAMRSAM